ncbi:MAG: RsmB/NOP family class I SAM-dependent RNA methyltransferase [Lachnospiraceae bacterium]|nr:RsmB/NOP family class I SAM-dependent RNA methyltransferase [Lachnospiraceae bacterium]
MNRLPEKFENKMKEILGDEFDAFIAGFNEPRFGGVRFNSLKIDREKWEKMAPFEVRPVPWTPNGYYYNLKDQPAKHPYYFAGLFYIQEPSAMTPASMLPVEPGDRVLDICAAPGGKSTELAAKLKGKGVLFSNDISNSRAKALLKNLELFGSRNSVVLSEAPGKLTERFKGYFNKILIDAPCSGEGMFRKSPAIMKNWEQYGTEYYHKLQLEIIDSVVPMLAPGGMMVYSTCTFDPDEDEGSIEYILNKWSDMHVVKPEFRYKRFAWGRPELVGSDKKEISNAVRLWPHILEGEGHFSALLVKDEGSDGFFGEPYMVKTPKLPDEVTDFFKHVDTELPADRLELRENRLYLVPEGIPDLKGLRIMRTGLLLGEMAKNRFEPSQALACALKAGEYDNVYDMDVNDEDVVRYLKCETVDAKTDVKDGWVLVTVEGFPLGWAKSKGNVLKNKYLPGWRMM